LIAPLHAIEVEIVGADSVEYNPVQDVAGMTATVAMKILKELLGTMIAERSAARELRSRCEAAESRRGGCLCNNDTAGFPFASGRGKV